MRRRDFIRFSAVGWLLVGVKGCAKSGGSDGWVDIKWDRDTCTRCRMVISDRRFAAEARGGPQNEVFKFDDIGCAVFWLRDQTWADEKSTRLWVVDATAHAVEPVSWLDARTAQYTAGRISPMGYNFAASATSHADAIAFEEMRRRVLARGR